MVIGRGTELGRVRWLLDRGAVTPCALVVEGATGIGKSTLVSAAITEAQIRDWTVLHCAPASTETGYAYAGLSDLVTEIPSGIHAVQRHALEAAIQRADGPADPHLVAAGAVSVLRALAADKPVLLVVDDTQWLDPETDAVLAFASRRLPARVAVLVARRAERPGVPPWGLDRSLGREGFGQLWLSGLSQEELHEVVYRQLGRGLPRPVMTRLDALCQGNPLMALEMASTLAIRVDPDEPWPVPDALLRQLTPTLQNSTAVLLAAAAMTSPTVEGLRTALEEDVTADLEAAEVAGIVQVHGNKVTFGHPLFASAIYGQAPAPRRRAVHRRLAAVELEPECRARHLALGVIGPDESVAQMLEDAAVDVRRCGGVTVAADLLRLARSRTPSHATVADNRRVVMLADALFESGDLNAARELLDEEIPGLAGGPLRARALMVRGTIAWHQEGGVVAAKLLESALDDAAADQELTGELHSRLAVFHDTDLVEAHTHAEKAVSVREPSADAVLNLFHTEIQLGLPPRTELLKRGLALEHSPRSLVPGLWQLTVDSTVDRARQRFTTMLERGDVAGEAEVLTRLAEVELAADNLPTARDYVTAATTAAVQLGQQFADATRAVHALIDAHAGQLGIARQVAEDGADRAEASGDLTTAVAYLHVLTFVAASSANPAAVLEYTARTRRHLATMGIQEPLGRLDPASERICALVELDRAEEAEAELAEFRRRYDRFPRPWMQPVLVRARATITAARGEINAAIEMTEPAPEWRQFDQARALLLRGRLMRRARRPGTAADTLAEAKAILTALGYPVWAAMAQDELDRVGRRRSATHLTGTERRVVELVVRGMTNKEVAATLFMSPRTVESHVARAYRKLGIRSRAELGRAITA